MFIRVSIAAVIVLISSSATAGIFQGDVAGVVLDEKRQIMRDHTLALKRIIPSRAL